jgi:hypothetical protein
MIKDRPTHLLADHAYSHRPTPPYALEWGAVPELACASIMDLGGIQPVMGAMVKAAGGLITDRPSEREIALFRERRTAFQMISVVASVAAVRQREGAFAVTPIALSLFPASKRGEVTMVSVDSVAALLGGEDFGVFEPGYVGYDFFSGEWSAYGPLGLIASGKGFLDEVGIVINTYFLATEFDPDDVLTMHMGMPTEKLEAKYCKRRRELLFQLFQRVEARRIWGVETPIELFLVQELARHGLHPSIQMLIMADGNTYPSARLHCLFDQPHLLGSRKPAPALNGSDHLDARRRTIWIGSHDLIHRRMPMPYRLSTLSGSNGVQSNLEFRHAPELITEADLYFPEQRVAVFCDGSHHERRKQQLKDESINKRLVELGIRPVRVPGRLINSDLNAAGRMVIQAVTATTRPA